jgi:hypothetical protein
MVHVIAMEREVACEQEQGKYKEENEKSFHKGHLWTCGSNSFKNGIIAFVKFSSRKRFPTTSRKVRTTIV